jgi:hypothetical protein
MTKKSSKSKKKQEESPPPTPANTMEVIPQAKFLTLCRQIKKHTGDKDSSVGEIRSLISNACEKQHLEKRAFAMYRSLARLSDEKLSETLAHLDYYRDIGGLDQRAAQQGQLFARPEAGEGEEGESGAEDDGKVVPMRAAAE